MKKGLTELVFILDRSGSMAGLESDTIGGFNAMIEKQKKEEGEALVTTVLFNNDIITVHDRLDVREVPKMTSRDYVPGGCTALIDAIGWSIRHVKTIHRYIREEDRPEHTLFVITTDGYENASHRFSSDEVKKMIEQQKAQADWEFLFLGANIDSVETAGSIGIDQNHAMNYTADRSGIAYSSSVFCKAASDVRRGRKIDGAWKQEAEQSRGKI